MPKAWSSVAVFIFDSIGFPIGNLSNTYMFSWADFSVSLAEGLWPACFRECGAQRSICLSADGSEKESLRICLNDDLHWSSWLDAIESCMSCWPMLVASKSVTLRCVGNVIYQASAFSSARLRTTCHTAEAPEIYQIGLNQKPFDTYLYCIRFYHINPGITWHNMESIWQTYKQVVGVPWDAFPLKMHTRMFVFFFEDCFKLFPVQWIWMVVEDKVPAEEISTLWLSSGHWPFRTGCFQKRQGAPPVACSSLYWIQ